jgi:hypothetical protein
MIWGGRTYAEELDEESCCLNPLDEQRRQTSETPYQIIRSSPHLHFSFYWNNRFYDACIILNKKLGLGLKVWEERNEKNISKSPNPNINIDF